MEQKCLMGMYTQAGGLCWVMEPNSPYVGRAEERKYQSAGQVVSSNHK